MKLTTIANCMPRSSPGFGGKAELSSQYINNFIKQSRLSDPAHILWQQEIWWREHSTLDHNFSLQDLLQCEHSDLHLKETSNSELPFECQHLIKDNISFSKGFWSIHCHKNIPENRHEFTINVNCGGKFCFHPKVVEDCITKKYGNVIYKSWRSMILDDLPCLEQLVQFVRSKITFVAPSVVCSENSARLCRRVGIPVRNDIAFLFPSNYS